MITQKLTLAVDFDGTIVHEEYPNIGTLRDGAKDVINQLYDDGHYIIINTCRADQTELEAAHFLYEQGIHFHSINQNQPGRILKYGGDCRKISADLYIDDRSINGLPSWDDIYQLVNERASRQV